MGIHIPVLLNECIDSLNIKKDGIYVDCTLGRAGHSSEILKRIPEGHLYCFDQDEEAIKESKARLEAIGFNFTIIKSNFAYIEEELAKLGVTKVDGILADLGVSSPQLDEAYRGFSYNADAPLDMRMDLDNPLTAKIVVNTYSLNDLTRVIRVYGEDFDAYSIAKSIVKRREQKPLETTFDLVDAIKAGKSRKSLRLKGHPAKQTFQAIRIEVNHEEEALNQMLEKAPGLLKKGGRLAIITFMSLDDRVVKEAFHRLSVIEGDRHGMLLRPEEVPTPDYHLFNKKPILPSEEELERNHRAASAKLRVLERN